MCAAAEVGAEPVCTVAPVDIVVTVKPTEVNDADIALPVDREVAAPSTTDDEEAEEEDDGLEELAEAEYGNGLDDKDAPDEKQGDDDAADDDEDDDARKTRACGMNSAHAAAGSLTRPTE